MGGCSSKRRDEVWVSEHLRIRWPRLSSAAELQSAVRYAVGKTEEGLGSMPGVMKRQIAAVCADLVIREVGTPELLELYTRMGGLSYVEASIDLLCSAKWRARTKGV